MIDTHHHLWNYSPERYAWIDDSMAELRRDFSVDHLRTLANDHGIDGFISVQASQTVEETETLLSLAANCDLIRGVIGWLPLADESIPQQLERFVGDPNLKGLRHVVQDEPDDEFILSRDFNRGVSELRGTGLIYEILILACQLAATIRFVDRHPDQSFVLNHIAKPAIRSGDFATRWHREIIDLARRPNVTCKFSGVATEIRDDHWSAETLRPYFDAAFEAFGPDRMMYASDWPVCLLRCDYAAWLAAVRELSAPLSHSEREAFFTHNAKRIYALG